METKLDEFYTVEELMAAGFQSVGSHVRVSRKTSLYGIKGSIGSHVRIDDFCTLKGEIKIGSYVHIAGYCSVSGAVAPVTFEDFSAIASRVSIYTGSDDYREGLLFGPTVPRQFVKTIAGAVTLQEASLVGAHTVVLPGVTIGRGATIGAQCLIFNNIEPGLIIVSPAAKHIRLGKRNLVEIEKACAAVRLAAQGLG